MGNQSNLLAKGGKKLTIFMRVINLKSLSRLKTTKVSYVAFILLHRLIEIYL